MHLQENTLFDHKKFRKFKVPNKGLFVGTDGQMDGRTDDEPTLVGN